MIGECAFLHVWVGGMSCFVVHHAEIRMGVLIQACLGRFIMGLLDGRTVFCFLV